MIVPLASSVAAVFALSLAEFLHAKPRAQHRMLVCANVLFDRAAIVAAFGRLAVWTLIRDQVNSSWLRRIDSHDSIYCPTPKPNAQFRHKSPPPAC